MDTNNKKLVRPIQGRMLGGVCASLAAYLGMDPTVIRVIYTLLTIFTVFSGFIVYLVLLFIIPEEPNIYKQ